MFAGLTLRAFLLPFFFFFFLVLIPFPSLILSTFFSDDHAYFKEFCLRETPNHLALTLRRTDKGANFGGKEATHRRATEQKKESAQKRKSATRKIREERKERKKKKKNEQKKITPSNSPSL
jgi:hypothetical protein